MQNNRFAAINYLFIQYSIILVITLMPHKSWSAGQLRVGMSLNSPPFSYVEKDETEPIGFCSDLAKLLAENMGMTAHLYAMDELSLRKALIDNNIDLVIVMRDAAYSTPDIYQIETTVKGIETKIFINSNYPPINSYKDLTVCKVAIEKGYNIPSFLPSEQMDMNSIEVNSMSEALALVDSGDADIYISKNLLATKQIIQKNHFQNIKEIGEPISISPLIIAVKKMNTELLTSISIAYGKSLENRSYFIIYNKWLNNNIRSYMDQYKKFIFAVLGSCILALLSFIAWNRTLKNKVVLITRNLKNSEKKYRDLIETSPDMICLVSMLGEIKLANKIALTHLGYDEKEITSLRLHNLVVPEQTDDVSNFINNVFRDAYSNKEFTFLTKDGKKIQVDMVATVVKEAEPAEKFVCCFSRDITERKRLEENLLHADRISIIGKMAAGIAHEINNPLGIILSNTQDILYNDLSNEETVESLKLIECSAIRTAKIIEDMLNFASPIELQIIPIDMPKLIDDSLYFLKQKLKEKNITVEKYYPDRLTGYNGDDNLFRQLLINILLNSIQAANHRGLIKIRINEQGDNDGGGIILEIEDNGIGIPEKNLNHIFTPFFTSRRENGGFGLGLFIAEIIVKKHSGSISVRSEVGKGTTVRMSFPSVV